MRARNTLRAHRLPVACVLAVAVIAAAVVRSGASSSASGTAERRGLIAYVARGAHAEIYVIRADGSDRRRLTGTPPYLPNRPSNFDPASAPNGRSIAFVSAEPRPYGRAGPARLFVMNADGTNAHAITPVGQIRQPAWSPDGTRIAFVRDEPAPSENALGGSSIRVVGADGSGEMRVTRPESGTAFDSSPDWSPDGSRIAFDRVVIDDTQQRVTEEGIYTVAADGSAATHVLNDAATPAWSPDGKRLAFISTRDKNGETCFEECSPNAELYVADADGANLVRLTKTTANEASPAWSPDGRRIAFSSDRNAPGSGGEIYSIGVDGTCMTWLTNGPLQSDAPAWQPAAGLASDPGACGAVPRRPTTGDVRPIKPRTPFVTYWLGPIFGNALSTGASGTDFHYDDCAVYDPSRCRLGLEIQNASICARHPLLYGGREPVPGGQILATARFKRRNVLVAYFPSAGGWDIYTGTSTVTAFGASRAGVTRVVDALRPLGGRKRALPAPAFPAREFWAKLNTVVRTYRALGSVAAAAHRLGIEERTVRDRLAWARLLATYAHPARHRCTRAERGPRHGPAPRF